MPVTKQIRLLNIKLLPITLFILLISFIFGISGNAFSAELQTPNKAARSDLDSNLDSKTANGPNVVVSIIPFHDLVSGILQGVSKPTLLLEPGASPHHYSLRPSEVAALHNADVIFWGGPDLESFLVKPLQSVGDAKTVSLSKTPKLILLATRTGKEWEHDHAHDQNYEHAHDHSEDHTHDDDNGEEAHHHGPIDMHFWRDPRNAIAMADYITKVLSEKDSSHAKIYQENNKKLKTRLQQLDLHLAGKLKKIQNKPFLVFHDAYQYFEKRYHLNAVGSITIHPELPLSLQRLNALRNIIKSSKAICVFSEPQFKPKLVERLATETGIKTGVLDPLGPKTSEGAEGYFQMLENLADSLVQCLE